MNNATSIVIGLAALVLIVGRQLRTREVRADRSTRILLVLALLGLWQSAQFLDAHPVAPVAVALTAAGLVMAAGFGALRGALQPVWRDDAGRVWRRGNVGTVGLWLVAIAAHLGWDVAVQHVDAHAAGLGMASLMLYLAISLGAQAAVVGVRAARLDAPVTAHAFAH